jgi:hypothetical protein
MRVAMRGCVAWIASMPLVVSSAEPSSEEIAQLESLVTLAEDVEAIKRLTFIFGYYRDNWMDEELLKLFTSDAELDVASGKFIGKASLRRAFDQPPFKPTDLRGRTGPRPDRLNDHILMQHVITVDDEGVTARARWKEFNTTAVIGQSQHIGSGVFENQYLKQDGEWRISAMAYCVRYERPYLAGAQEAPTNKDPPPVPEFYPANPLGPDRQSNYACQTFPDAGISPPFHFSHPVTGETIRKP